MADFNPCTHLIPTVVDHFAQVKGDEIYTEFPISPVNYEEGYRKVTWKDLANAVNGVAKWLTEKLGPGNGEALAYVGPNDVRYPALCLGAIKAGYCMFLTSPRNSPVANQSLLTRLECKTLITPSPRPAPATAIIETCEVNVLEVPSVDELLGTEHPHVPFEKSWPAAAKETLVILHTSGSTGIPKPIFWTHDTACKHMETVRLPPPEGYESQDHWNFNKRMYLVPPPFHAAGVAYQLFIAPSIGISLITPTAGTLPSAAGLVAARKETPFETALVVPSIIQELSQSPDLLDYVSKNMTHLVYCGGDLPQQTGDIVASKIRLVNQYGATEVGMMPYVHNLKERDPIKDWRWLDFNPEEGAEMRHVSGGEYELVIVHSPERERHQFAFTVKDKPEYGTSDLFVRHPEKPDLWRWSARTDDVIVFLNGEKTNPVSMEQHIIASNPEVYAALVTGAQRFQAALLVQFKENKTLDVNERAAMIEKLWPSIEEANAVCPAHARIAKTHIMFTTAEKPMLVAGKGTIQRAGTLAQYRPELDALYADADMLSENSIGGEGPGNSTDPVIVSKYLRQSILDVAGWKNDLSDSDNWFSRGVDSLQIITLTRALRRGLNLPTLSPNVIYLNSTVADLTKAVIQLHQEGEKSAEEIQKSQLQERDDILQELIGQIDIPSSTPAADQTVILTGSTGNLGAFILDALLKDPSVKHVYCLNRRQNADKVQAEKTAAYNLNVDTSRVTFWTADLSKPDFGLEPERLQKLQETVTLTIHNAWAVNFNLSLSSFKPNLASVVNLINFTGQAKHNPGFYFISSISSMLGYSTENGLTPEQVITSTIPAPNGYANSKYLSEHLLASVSSKISPAFARVGQVAGPVRAPGLWNKTEWFPSLVLSSLHLGALPDTFGPALDRIDWVPIDLLAEVLVDLALATKSTADGEVKVHHPHNLNPLTWTEIRPAVAAALAKKSGKTVETVPFREWLQLVRKDIESAGGGRDKAIKEAELQVLLAKNPAAKLLEFFEHVMAQTAKENVLDTKLTAERSEKLRAVGAVKAEWIEKWVGEWLQ